MTYTDWQRTEHVRELQEYLRAVALLDNNHRELAVDGIFGPETAEAVRMYQAANQLPVTGQVDSRTWERLVQDYAEALSLFTKAVPLSVFPAAPFSIRTGDRSNNVYILQAMLNTLGEAEGLDALIVNGIYDAPTEERVRLAQQLSGFPQTGVVDRPFWNHLATWYNHA